MFIILIPSAPKVILVSNKISFNAVMSVRKGAICTVLMVSTFPSVVDGDGWLLLLNEDMVLSFLILKFILESLNTYESKYLNAIK
jgi:hypothetical protein